MNKKKEGADETESEENKENKENKEETLKHERQGKMIRINNKHLCEYCFSEIISEPCPICGFRRDSHTGDPSVLPVSSLLENRYLTGGVIGKGGFGITYLAYDMKLDYQVAVKEYYPYGIAVREMGAATVSAISDATEETFQKGAGRFYEEARMVAKFNENPNIVSVYDFFYANNTVYFVMGFLKGQTLKEYIDEQGVLSPAQAVFLANAVCHALIGVHQMDVLHRDISPDNIMICNDRTIKLLDFGAARQVTAEGSKSISIILKQGFAPLEQYQKRGNQGAWTDIYSLGAVLYYALTKETLDDPISRLEKEQELNKNRRLIPEKLQRVIKKAVMLKPTDRYQSVQELLDALGGTKIQPEQLNEIKNRKEALQFVQYKKTRRSLSPSESEQIETAASYEPGVTLPLEEEETFQEEPELGVTQPFEENKTFREEPELGVTLPLEEKEIFQEEKELGAVRPLEEKEISQEGKELGAAQSLEEKEISQEEPELGTAQSLKKKKIKYKIIRPLVLFAAAAVVVAASILLFQLIQVYSRGYRYRIHMDYAELVAYYGEGEAEIPSEFLGRPVTVIGAYAFTECDNLTKVEIPDSVVVIKEGAFFGCEELKNVKIPKSVESIGENAFASCTGLTIILIPAETEVADSAFAGCTMLDINQRY